MKWLRLAWSVFAAAACIYVAARILVEGPLIGQIGVLIVAAVAVITLWISMAVDRIDLLSQRRFDALSERIRQLDDGRID